MMTVDGATTGVELAVGLVLGRGVGARVGPASAGAVPGEGDGRTAVPARVRLGVGASEAVRRWLGAAECPRGRAAVASTDGLVVDGRGATVSSTGIPST